MRLDRTYLEHGTLPGLMNIPINPVFMGSGNPLFNKLGGEWPLSCRIWDRFRSHRWSRTKNGRGIKPCLPIGAAVTLYDTS